MRLQAIYNFAKGILHEVQRAPKLKACKKSRHASCSIWLKFFLPFYLHMHMQKKRIAACQGRSHTAASYMSTFFATTPCLFTRLPLADTMKGRIISLSSCSNLWQCQT
mmetsp:Transcript_38890/g.85148  ORF Transcript_38890/g.85148 Transcript_38890/m.85148 type:complete len:108 (-) Transcript_38890:1317-1640(-)